MLGWLVGGAGCLGLLLAFGIDSGPARSAASQVWPPFVLVTGLLLVGLAADRDGLFAAAGRRLSATAPTGPALVAGAAATVAVATAVLNLDTSVAFVTPVLVHLHRNRSPDRAAAGAGTPAPNAVNGDAGDEGRLTLLLATSLLLANAGSLLLPGSNLTNLIVVGHLQLTGQDFVARMALPWLAAVVVTGGVVTAAEWRRTRTLQSRGSDTSSLAGQSNPSHVKGQVAGARFKSGSAESPSVPDVGGDAGAVWNPRSVPALLSGSSVCAVVVLMVILRNAALSVVGVGIALTIFRLVRHHECFERVRTVVGFPVLAGLFGIAVGLGTLGRVWTGPSVLLDHLDVAGTATLAASASVILNNLPAASLLASGSLHHPYALLVGLNVGPNLFATGSLAWFLWWKTSWSTGCKPPVRRTILLGMVSVPLAIVAALAALALTGPR